MFTGLVAELGTVRGLKRVQNSYHLTVAARKVLDNLKTVSYTHLTLPTTSRV